MESKKVCRKCHKAKPQSEFYKGKARCKECNNAEYREWAKGIGRGMVNACNNRYYHLAKNSKGYKYMRCKSGAKQRKIDFTLTKQEFFKIYGAKCVYCGEQYESMGLDRVDSNLGYSLENVVSCCKRCNQAKNDMTQEDFINHCRKIVEKYDKSHPSTSQDSQ